MQYLEGLQMYLMLCIGALILINLPMIAYISGFVRNPRPYFECTDFCFLMNYIVAVIHTVLVLSNVVATNFFHFFNGKNEFARKRSGFRVMFIKFTLLVVSFIVSIIVESGLLNSPHDLWLFNFIFSRLHFTIELLQTLFNIGAILFDEKRSRRALLSRRSLVLEPMDVWADTSRWQFLAPLQGYEVAHHDLIVLPTSLERRPIDASNYIESAVVDPNRKKVRPLSTFSDRTFNC